MFSSESYDTIFATDPEYNCQYKRSSYLPVWRIVASKLAKDDVIMDLGCGPGQFAGYLHDMGFTRYRGIDFSRVAIEKARSLVPAFQFICADINKMDFRNQTNQTFTAIETFEHIADDRDIILRMPPARLIFTVPNYGAPNHYRTYHDENFIRKYYGNILTVESITRYRCNRSAFIFIVDSFTHRKQ